MSKTLIYDILKNCSKKHGFSFEEMGNMLSVCKTDIGNIFFYDQIPQTTYVPSHYACKNRAIAKHFLNKHGINTPNYIILDSSQKKDAYQWIKNINTPAVIKPLDSQKRKAVSLNIKTIHQIDTAFRHAKIYSKKNITRRDDSW